MTRLVGDNKIVRNLIYECRARSYWASEVAETEGCWPAKGVNGHEKAEPEGCWPAKGVNGPTRKQNQKDAGPQRV
ncbi:hypothetical protein BSG1_19225 [Bacillus sp. SG-1]|nr:hypothetical protein BSG1_19225 [Bacillus sp. SG-1]